MIAYLNIFKWSILMNVKIMAKNKNCIINNFSRIINNLYSLNIKLFTFGHYPFLFACVSKIDLKEIPF